MCFVDSICCCCCDDDGGSRKHKAKQLQLVMLFFVNLENDKNRRVVYEPHRFKIKFFLIHILSLPMAYPGAMKIP